VEISVRPHPSRSVRCAFFDLYCIPIPHCLTDPSRETLSNQVPVWWFCGEFSTSSRSLSSSSLDHRTHLKPRLTFRHAFVDQCHILF
jgi:hypothetical protein